MMANRCALRKASSGPSPLRPPSPRFSRALTKLIRMLLDERLSRCPGGKNLHHLSLALNFFLGNRTPNRGVDGVQLMPAPRKPERGQGMRMAGLGVMTQLVFQVRKFSRRPLLVQPRRLEIALVNRIHHRRQPHLVMVF